MLRPMSAGAEPSFLQQACVYLGAAVVSVPIAKRLGLGSVLGYLIAGAVIGAWGFKRTGANPDVVRHGGGRWACRSSGWSASWW